MGLRFFMRSVAERCASLLALPRLLAAWAPMLLDAGARPAARRAFARWGTHVLSGDAVWRACWPNLYALEPFATWRAYGRRLEAAEAETPVRAPPPSRPQRLLVVGFGHIGDILHTAPMIRRLKAAGIPHVTWMVGPWSRDLAIRMAVADEVVSHTPIFEQYHRGDIRALLTEPDEAEWRTRLRGLAFDTVVTTSPTGPADFYVVRASGASRWIGARPGPATFPALPVEHVREYESSVYEAERLLRLVEPLVGTARESPELRFPVTGEEESAARTFLADGWRGIGIAPGTGWPGKNWPADRFAELALRVREMWGLPVLIVGSEAERPAGEAICAAGAPGSVNAAGRTRLGVSAALVSRCAALVTNDGGLLHIAVARKVPVVALFGPTKPEQWGPRVGQGRVIRKVAGCPRCIPWHPRTTCADGGSCMKRITCQDVVEELRLLLGR